MNLKTATEHGNHAKDVRKDAFNEMSAALVVYWGVQQLLQMFFPLSLKQAALTLWG